MSISEISKKQRSFFSKNALSFGIVLGVLAVCIIAFQLWEFFPGTKEKDGQTAAAWFQAVGSIAAIVGSLWISERQTKAALASVIHAQSCAEAAKRSSILAIAEAANEHAKKIGMALAEPDVGFALFAVYDKEIIKGMVGALSDIPVHEVGSRDGVMALLSLRNQFVFLGKAVESAIAGPIRHPGLGSFFEQYIQPDCVEERVKRFASGSGVLAKNVQTHLGRIHQDYENLKKSIENL